MPSNQFTLYYSVPTIQIVYADPFFTLLLRFLSKYALVCLQTGSNPKLSKAYFGELYGLCLGVYCNFVALIFLK